MMQIQINISAQPISFGQAVIRLFCPDQNVKVMADIVKSEEPLENTNETLELEILMRPA